MSDLESINKKFIKEINAGTSSLILLSILDHSGNPMYGYQIGKQLETGEEDAAKIKQGALYPVLRSMEKSGLLESAVEPSVSGPPRRYYQITNTGREVLTSWTHIWNQTKSYVDDILQGVHHE